MLNLNAPQQQAIKGLLGRLKDNTATLLDASDPATLAAIHLFFDLANRDSSRYPGLHAGLGAATPAADSAALDAPQIVDLGLDSQGRATSRTWIGSTGLPLMSGAATIVFDEAGQPVAFGSASMVGEALVQVSTSSATAKPATGKLTVLTVYHTVPSAAAPPRVGAIATSRLVGVGQNPDINVTAPIGLLNPGLTGWVMIGLNRPGPQPDVDYSFLESAPQNDPPLLVPFTGTANVLLPISGIQPNGQISGLIVSSVMYAPLSTGNQVAPANPGALAASVTSSTSTPTILTWGYPYVPPQPIVYGAAANVFEAKCAFFFQFIVPTGPISTTFNVCSVDTPNEPSTFCKQIQDIKFTWHCLAGDSLVTRDDGATARLDAVDATVRLRSGLGDDSLAVEATWYGTHSGPVVRLATALGQQLIATAAHPIMTPRGLVAAGELKPGDRVLVAGGATAALTAVERVAYAGKMWNVKLGNAQDRAAGYNGTTTPGLFVANGIVVGDIDAQGRLYRNTRRDLDFMAPRLPASHRRDYQSSLEDLPKY